MTLSAAIKERLLANETVRALCDNRVSPLFAGPFNAIEGQEVDIRPAVTLECVSRAEQDYEGMDEAGPVLVHRYRITALSRDFDEAEQIGKAVRASLHFFAGDIAEGVSVVSCRLDAGYHSYEPGQGISLDINEFEIVAAEA